MSILIKGMTMPTSCWRCSLSQLYEKPREMLVCKVTHEEVLRHKIDSNCPLVPVPPHGDLIDRDELRKSFRESIDECHNWANEMREAENEEMVIRAEQSLGTFVECSLRAKNAPTVIEAEVVT